MKALDFRKASHHVIVADNAEEIANPLLNVADKFLASCNQHLFRAAISTKNMSLIFSLWTVLIRRVL